VYDTMLLLSISSIVINNFVVDGAHAAFRKARAKFVLQLTKTVEHADTYGAVTEVISKSLQQHKRLYVLETELREMNGFQSLHRNNVPLQNPCAVEDVMFIVMGSHKKRDVTLAHVKYGWLADVPHKYIFSDEDDPDSQQMTLPELKGRRFYKDAQQRQIAGLKWLWKKESNIHNFKWFMLVDDDTHVNVGALSSFLQRYSPDIPIAIGHIVLRRRNPFFNFFQGGSGMIFSQAATVKLVETLYSDLCPCRYGTHNDICLTLCCKQSGVLRVHSPLFKTGVHSFRLCMNNSPVPWTCFDPLIVAYHRVPWTRDSSMNTTLSQVKNHLLSSWNCSFGQGGREGPNGRRSQNASKSFHRVAFKPNSK